VNVGRVNLGCGANGDPSWRAASDAPAVATVIPGHTGLWQVDHPGHAGHHDGMRLRIVTGDATEPEAEGNKILAHVCNDVGGWGKGFVLAISRRWPEPEREYRRWHRGRAANDFSLGAVQVVAVQPDLWVVASRARSSRASSVMQTMQPCRL
jgi:hypothetical protein